MVIIDDIAADEYEKGYVECERDAAIARAKRKLR
jgi:hypothetical protein